MPVTVIKEELGQSMPPHGPHTVTVHIPGWDTAMLFRKGDKTIHAALKSMYPRFGPTNEAKQLAAAIHPKLSLPETYLCQPFASPDVFAAASEYAFSHWRKEEFKLEPSELLFRVVDIADTRLYVLAYPAAKGPGIMGVWQNLGGGISTRLAEHLLAHIETLAVDSFEASGSDGVAALEKVPETTYLPEGDAHQQIRERIVELLQRVPVGDVAQKVVPADVFLYNTGMAAVYRLHQAMLAVRPGTVVVLGAVFSNTWNLFKETPTRSKHFGRCDAESGVMDKLEEYLAGEQDAGRQVSYVFAEFPSNPILVSIDLKRLRMLADEYGFAVVLDETIGSYSNIDVLPMADVLVTSLTKSFSGYANVMAGSVVVSPSSTLDSLLKSTLTARFRNELFLPDASVLLSNSQDYLPRSTILNRNALTLAKFLLTHSASESSPITGVLYPPMTNTLANYTAHMRPATADFTPGYGCLLSIDFSNAATAKAFYDNLAVYHGPHLGAHRTLAFPFNDAIWGGGADPLTDPDFMYHISYGLRPEQVRVAVGLESEEELVDTFAYALQFAVAAAAAAEK
ncbi:pyridoxal phosphate-dependent transferase [Podospora didyma]|uniref:Pyridoxal phosphate-dependent transferase n=1 Tax=Podospora didyma TaxID=330526 RepID=A0AAE0P4J3_9PEZI|nr:pyridoxal phosphate-dependent transferase [Podospora didyma]